MRPTQPMSWEGGPFVRTDLRVAALACESPGRTIHSAQHAPPTHQGLFSAPTIPFSGVICPQGHAH